MRLTADYFYHFPNLNLGARGRCRVRIYKRDNGTHTVLLSELASNTGEPITSACASIATDLVNGKRLNPKTTRWIQHDLPHEGEPQRFDEIKFEWQNDEIATNPVWSQMDAELTETLTGSSPDELTKRLGSEHVPTAKEVRN